MPGTSLPPDAARSIHDLIARVERLERQTSLPTSASAAKTRLEDLSDVNIPSAPAGAYVLYYDSTDHFWEAIKAGLLVRVEDLSDVNITSKSDGDLVVWDAGSAKWVNLGIGGLLPAPIPQFSTMGGVEAHAAASGTGFGFDIGAWTIPTTFGTGTDLSIDGTGNLVTSAPHLFAVTVVWNAYCATTATFTGLGFAISGGNVAASGMTSPTLDSGHGHYIASGSLTTLGLYDPGVTGGDLVLENGTGATTQTVGDNASTVNYSADAYVVQII